MGTWSTIENFVANCFSGVVIHCGAQLRMTGSSLDACAAFVRLII